MKKVLLILGCLMILFMPATAKTYCAVEENAQIEFLYSGKVFNYYLDKNIKQSDIFDANYQINKYNRFGSAEERKNLLKHMLSLGFDKEVAINYLFPNINKKINEIAKNIEMQPREAKLNINSNTEKVFTITPEVVGITLNKVKLYDEICTKFLLDKSMIFNVPIIKTVPETTKEYYQKFTNLRADFSTDISSSSADRKHNVKNALNSLNKVEIAPNQVFSFNKTVGRRTEENGYRPAKIIVNNEFVEGLGGGVCQVSTTLYNAALLAGMEIKEANKHSKQVGYVKYGFDAMVNFGSSDLKFKNNTSQKIIIITNCTGNKARIRIFGEDLNGVTYKLKNEIVKVEEPKEEVRVDENGQYKDKVVYEDESFYLQRASRGMEINSYREKYVDGMLVDEQRLRNDKFKVQNAIKIVGAKKREANIFEMLDFVS